MSRPGVTATSPWVPRRRRAEVLRDRYPFAAEVLTLYLALLDVWEEAWGTAGEEPSPVQCYLARASLRAPIEALDAPPTRDPSPTEARRCPRCGGPPQLSFHAHSDDGLVTGHRHLVCAHCWASWSYAARACASCGETAGARRTVYEERRERPVVGRGDGSASALTFPHLRIEG